MRSRLSEVGTLVFALLVLGCLMFGIAQRIYDFKKGKWIEVSSSEISHPFSSTTSGVCL